jgi:carboxymethylenebutenolidase
MERIEISTRDGACPSYVFRPSGAGPWPAVLMFMDGIGIRPAVFEVAAAIADRGHLVLLPDLFYRSGPYAPMNPHTVFSVPEERKMLMEKFFSKATSANVMSDTGYFLDWLDACADAKPGKRATTGYCLGGLMSLTAAGHFPDRIAATASFHGGRLATDAPDSPHLLAPKIQSRVYVAGAIEDASFPDEMKARLEQALTEAGVDHRIETYPAKHGWVFSDTPVSDPAQSARHLDALTTLVAETIGRAG